MKKDPRREAVELVISLAFLWFALHPAQLEELDEKVRTWLKGLQYRHSVWTAIRAIRTLPETPE